jgi:hypothetical protein
MYKLPVNFDAKPLIGRTLELICFSKNQLYLHFDQDVRITICLTFSHEKTNEKMQTSEFPLTTSDLMQLLESVVSNVAWDENSNISLFFLNGHALHILNPNEMYESYQIKIGDRNIIV